VKPKICVPLPAGRLSDLAPMIRRAEDSGADLIEIRLDYPRVGPLRALDELTKVIKQASVPFIATNRQYQQGGLRPQDEKRRIEVLVSAANIGFQFVDIELTSADLRLTVQRVKDCGAKPIVSHHDLEGTPSESEMERIVRSEIEAGAEVCKLVTTAKLVDDNIRCLVFTQRLSQVTNIVCFAMGWKGLLSRAFSPFFGGYFTFASLDDGLETAPGQLSIADLERIYRTLGVIE